MKRYYMILIVFLLSGYTYAQTADDALRYSRHSFNSTARSTAMGGAFGALGGDFSSISINPAGIAVYQSSEFTITPSLKYIETTSTNDAASTVASDDRFNFGFSNLGYVATFKPRLESKNGWKNFNFAIGYNRLDNFKRSSISKAPDAPTSLIDVMVLNADGYNENNLADREYLAYETYVILPDEDNPTLYNAITSEKLNQMQTVDEKGYAGEYVIAFGGNYNHKLYIGGSLGIQSLYYKSNIRFSESIQAGSDSDFNNYTYEEYYKTSGVGVNFKLGLIYKPTNFLRLGASIHTPTFYSMDDEYQKAMFSHFNTPDENGYTNYAADTPYGDYSYKFRTPMRMEFSGAFVISKKLILSADYEIIDYSRAKFYDGGNGEDFYGTDDAPDTNDIIKMAYSNTSNLRTGLEFRVSPAISLRGGFARMGNPFNDSAIDEAYNIYSSGFGIRHGNFFFDMSYSYSNKETDYYYYSTNDFASDLISDSDKNHEVKMTFGFRF